MNSRSKILAVSLVAVAAFGIILGTLALGYSWWTSITDSSMPSIAPDVTANFKMRGKVIAGRNDLGEFSFGNEEVSLQFDKYQKKIKTNFILVQFNTKEVEKGVILPIPAAETHEFIAFKDVVYKDGWLFWDKAINAENCSGSLRIEGEAVAGLIKFDGKSYLVEHAGKGLHVIFEEK